MFVNENENENGEKRENNEFVNESASIQNGAYGCYGRMALNP